MPRYTVQHRYFAIDNGQPFGTYEPGTTVDLDEDRAEWINRDSPGTLAPELSVAEPVATEELPADEDQPDAAEADDTDDQEPEGETEPGLEAEPQAEAETAPGAPQPSKVKRTVTRKRGA